MCEIVNRSTHRGRYYYKIKARKIILYIIRQNLQSNINIKNILEGKFSTFVFFLNPNGGIKFVTTFVTP